MDDTLKNQIEEKINSHDIFLVMKGTPEKPMCGFSAGVVQCLNQLGVSYGSFNVLENESIRQGIKEYANWPTIPQLYAKGEFVGGHDIVVQMLKSGELVKKLKV